MATLLSPKYLVLTVITMTAVITGSSAQNPPAPDMTLIVDETQASRRIAFVREEIRVLPGALALAYRDAKQNCQSRRLVVKQRFPSEGVRPPARIDRIAAMESQSKLVTCYPRGVKV
jgi:hypothetical protein